MAKPGTHVLDLVARLHPTPAVAGAPRASTPRGDYVQNRWSAARFGLDAPLIHPDGDRVVPARELARQLLGGEPPEPEASRQLEVGLEGAAADLVRRTLV